MCNVQALESDYVINQMDENIWKASALNEMVLENLPKAIHSQYVDMTLRNFISVNENRNYQDYPSTIQHPTLVGKPISSNELRCRVDGLESSVYSPMIVEGKLYFVNLEEDVRTAQSSPSVESLMVKTAVTSNSFNDDDITFTLAELKSILPSYAIKKLMKHYNANRMHEKAMSREERDLLKVQDALTTLEPIDLMDTSDADLVKLRETLNLGPPASAPPLPAKNFSRIPQNMEDSASVTGETTSTTSSLTGAGTTYTVDSNYSRKNIEETCVDVESVPMSRKESKTSTVATGKESSGKTAFSRTILTGVMPSDSVHTATSTEEFFDDVKTATDSSWKQLDDIAKTYMPHNKEEFNQMLKTISVEELNALQTAAVISPSDREPFKYVDECHN